MMKHDLPASIDFVRKTTGQDKVSYFGHSQGTTQMFGALANNEQMWASRINLFIAAAPVILPNKNSMLFKASSQVTSIIYQSMTSLGIPELFGTNQKQAQKILQSFAPQLSNAVMNQFAISELNDPVRA
jgi:pimeloyl-ACP methyl ester carboxylesterase